MSVIIRLQNLPWSANAMDIRQFFKGLSIPEGGVHIVGGEMGDAFIAFSTDEDARQAMMHDRDKINEVQVRLLLSSRAEMQKVIETARQQSMLALQNATTVLPKVATATATAAATGATAAAAAIVTPSVAAMQAAKAAAAAPSLRVAPQPPVITANSLQKILGTQLSPAPSFQAYQQQAGITYTEKSMDSSDSTDSRRNSSERRNSSRRSDSRSPSRDRSRWRDRRDRSSRSRSRELDYKSSSSSSRRMRRSRSRDRSRERSRSRERNSHRSGGRSGRNSRDRDRDDSGSNGNRPKPGSINPWNVPPAIGAGGGGGGSGGGSGYQVNLVGSPGPNSPNPFAAVAAVAAAANSNPIIGNPNNPFAQTPVAAAAASGLIPNALVAAISSLANANVGKAGATGGNPLAMMPAFQNYTSNAASTVMNAYNIGLFGNSAGVDPNSAVAAAAAAAAAAKQQSKLNALQNPYTATAMAANAAAAAGMPNAGMMNVNALLKRKGATEMMKQEPIAFASTNPYAQLYPNLFTNNNMPMAGGAGGGGSGGSGGGSGGSGVGKSTAHAGPSYEPGTKQQHQHGHSSGGGGGDKSNDGACIKVTNICSSVSYSDLRRFFYGLYIPHNGIKMVNDRHGLRVGVAYIQFTRTGNVPKALALNNTQLKNKAVRIEPVPEADFLDAEDSFRPQNRHDDRRGGGGGNNNSNSNADSYDHAEKEQLPFSVLFVKEIPGFATEQDVMKMFSAYTIIDILLTPSPENRRENIAHVRFSRDTEAKAALANEACHIITHRKVRVSAGSVEEMDRAKEKLRLANEQLIKEEQALAEQEEAARLAAEAEAEAQAKAQEQAAAAAEAEALRAQQNIDDSGITIIDDADANCLDDGGGDQHDNEDEYMPRSIHDHQPPKRDMRDPRQRQRQNSRFDCAPNQLTSSQDNNNDCMAMSAQMPMPMMVNNNNNNNMNNNINNNNNNFNMMNALPIDENCFVIMKNCVYNTRINDIADVLATSNLRPKHVELLRNERNLPSGEFIVEFRDAIDADIAIKDFNNTQFRNRNLRVYTIRPQQIADRLGKPFMNYFPGGGGGGGGNNGGGNYGPPNGSNMMMGGGGGGGGGGRGDNNNSGGGNGGFNNGGNTRRRGNNRRNRRGGAGRNNNGKTHDNPFDVDMDDDMDNGSNDGDNDNSNDGMSHRSGNAFSDSNNGNNNTGGGGGGGNNDGDGIPPKFNQPGCVIAMENVPFRADLKAIMKFFNEFDVSPDDIIRRFNDDGTPTGDARVAFSNPDQARAAFEAKRRKHIFNRTVYLSLLN